MVEEEIPPPYGMALNKIEDATIRLWNLRWSNTSDYRQTKQWFPTPNKAIASRLVKLDRKCLGYAVQLITGHNRLRYHES